MPSLTVAQVRAFCAQANLIKEGIKGSETNSRIHTKDLAAIDLVLNENQGVGVCQS